ncbi:unnamed protein product [Caretta caretta]
MERVSRAPRNHHSLKQLTYYQLIPERERLSLQTKNKYWNEGRVLEGLSDAICNEIHHPDIEGEERMDSGKYITSEEVE